MPSRSNLFLAVVLVLLSVARALVMAPVHALTAGRSALQAHRHGCICMGCRRNLKKEKRARNRVNAFRFKPSNYGPKRFNNNFVDRAAQKEKETVDAEYTALIYTHMAAQAAEEAVAAAAAPAAEPVAA